MARYGPNNSLTCELNTFSSFERHYLVSRIIIMFLSPRFIFKRMSISSSLARRRSGESFLHNQIPDYLEIMRLLFHLENIFIHI